MDNSHIYTEKTIGHFTASYRENAFTKPQDVDVTITPSHIYGTAYIWEQVGTKEDGPNYMRYTCALEEITKIEINSYNKSTPIYIQCDDTSKSVVTRRRIILPSFDNNDEIVKLIADAKFEADKKLEKKKADEKNQKLKELESRKKAMDDEFESMTSGYEDFKKSMAAKSKPAAEPAAEPAPEPKPAPAPAPKPEPKPAPKPAPAPAPTPKPAPAPAPAPAPKPAPKPAPAPAPKPDVVHMPEPIPFPEIKKTVPQEIKPLEVPENTAEEMEPVSSIPEPTVTGSVTVDDILGLNEYLGIKEGSESSAAPEKAPEPAEESSPEEKAVSFETVSVEAAAVEETADDKPEETAAEKPEETVPAADSVSEPEKYPDADDDGGMQSLSMDSIDKEPDEEMLNSIPEEILQKKPAEIDEIAIPAGGAYGLDEEPKQKANYTYADIEELDPSKEIAKKLAAKPEAKKPAPAAPAPEPVKEEEPEPVIEKKAVDMSLDEFEAAMKKLRSMLDNGVITQSEFAQEKRKLLSTLY